MSRQLEQVREERQLKADRSLVRAVEYGLVGGVAESGGTLLGLSVKLQEKDVLVTLRVEREGVLMVSFVGAESFADALRKAERMAWKDELQYRDSKF